MTNVFLIRDEVKKHKSLPGRGNFQLTNSITGSAGSVFKRRKAAGIMPHKFGALRSLTKSGLSCVGMGHMWDMILEAFFAIRPAAIEEKAYNYLFFILIMWNIVAFLLTIESNAP